MELQRELIERRDFPTARRGYDPESVDRHLREVAEAVERLKATPAAPSVSGAAAERVQGIVQAAEESARQIEQQARDDARSTGERAQEVVDALEARADALRQQVDKILAQLGQAAQDMREQLATVAEPPAGAPPAPPAAKARPAPVVEEEVAAVAEIPAEPVPEPGPPDAEPKVVEKAKDSRAGSAPTNEGARLIALNMALSGTPREETARYLRENFDLSDQDDLLDEVYARAGG
jgi:DivIVA domain-containing protein